MRFMITMHMPSGRSDTLVHQIIADHPSETCREFCEVLCDEPFVTVRQWYYEDDRATGERIWIDRGDLILNSAHIGKVMQHYSPTQNQAPSENTLTLPRRGRANG